MEEIPTSTVNLAHASSSSSLSASTENESSIVTNRKDRIIIEDNSEKEDGEITDDSDDNHRNREIEEGEITDDSDNNEDFYTGYKESEVKDQTAKQITEHQRATVDEEITVARSAAIREDDNDDVVLEIEEEAPPTPPTPPPPPTPPHHHHYNDKNDDDEDEGIGQDESNEGDMVNLLSSLRTNTNPALIVDSREGEVAEVAEVEVPEVEVPVPEVEVPIAQENNAIINEEQKGNENEDVEKTATTSEKVTKETQNVTIIVTASPKVFEAATKASSSTEPSEPIAILTAETTVEPVTRSLQKVTKKIIKAIRKDNGNNDVTIQDASNEMMTTEEVSAAEAAVGKTVPLPVKRAEVASTATKTVSPSLPPSSSPAIAEAKAKAKTVITAAAAAAVSTSTSGETKIKKKRIIITYNDKDNCSDNSNNNSSRNERKSIHSRITYNATDERQYQYRKRRNFSANNNADVHNHYDENTYNFPSFKRRKINCQENPTKAEIKLEQDINEYIRKRKYRHPVQIYVSSVRQVMITYFNLDSLKLLIGKRFKTLHQIDFSYNVNVHVPSKFNVNKYCNHPDNLIITVDGKSCNEILDATKEILDIICK